MMRTIGIIFYAAILIIIGIKMIFFAIAFSFPAFQPEAVNYVNSFLNILESNASARLMLFLAGILLILISFSIAQFILGRFQREKNIAFKTGNGEVTIALSAVEDLIRRLTEVLPEIKELRPDVRATKKGDILVDLRVVLRTEANIPELTARLQELARSRIQEVLGIEEEVFIKIYVTKIVAPQGENRKRKDTDKQEPPVPFAGFGKV